jgi:hypothetical protein
VRYRAGVAILSSLVLAMTLVACDPLVSNEDPIAVRLNDGVFELSVCTPWPLTRVLVQTRATAFGSQWQDALVAEGRTELASGDVLTSQSPPVGLTSSSWAQPQLAPGDELEVTLGGDDDQTLNASIVVPMSGLPRGGWLQADGTETDSAC